MTPTKSSPPLAVGRSRYEFRKWRIQTRDFTPFSCIRGRGDTALAGETVAVRQRYFEEVGRHRLTMCFGKSAGTARSRRCQSAKKGFGGGSLQQAKSGISAPAEIPDFPHLYIQMPSLHSCKVFVDATRKVKTHFYSVDAQFARP